jgi:predicted porin
MKSLNILIVLLTSLYFLNVSAQEVDDFGIWLGSDVSYELVDDFDVSGSMGLRTNDNSTHIRQFFFQLGGSYKITKGFKTGLSYRARSINDYDDKALYHRLIWDVSYKYKLEKASFQIRNRMQRTSGLTPNVYDRVRLKAKFEMDKDLEGFVFTEFFYKLNDSYNRYYQKQRWGIGMEYKVNKEVKVALQYIRQNDLVGAYRVKMNIFDLGVGISI